MAGRFSVEAVFSAIDKVTGPVTKMQATIGRMTRSVERGLRSVTSVTNTVVKGIGSATGTIVKFGAVGFGALAAGIALVTREFSKVENAEAAFTPLMGGAEKARKLVDELNKAAATTPFQFETLADAAGQLLPVMNGDIERTIRTMRMLGDTAGGNAQKLDSITRGFTKAMLKGKVDLESLNMIGEAGVPIFDDLAAVMGTKVNAAFFKMISAGKVTTKQLEAAFVRMTSSGGKFFQGMEIASRTTTGMLSSLEDNVSLTAAEIGGVLSPTIKEIISTLDGAAQKVRAWVIANRELIQTRVTEFIERAKRAIETFIDRIIELDRQHSILDRIADGFGAVADAITWLVEHGEGILTLTKLVGGLVIALNVLVGVLTLVNLLMTLNPIGLIVIGIVAAIAAVTALVTYVDELVAMLESAPQWVRALLGPFELVLRAIKLIKDEWDSITGGVKKFAAFVGFDVGEPPTAPVVAQPAADTSRFTGGLVPSVVTPPTPAVSAPAPVLRVVPTVNVDVAPVISSPVVPPLLQSPTFGQPSANDDTQPASAPAPVMVSPQERVSRSIEERHTSSSAELTIQDKTGRVQVTKGKLDNNIQLKRTGQF